MKRNVIVSSTFVKQFAALPKPFQKRIRAGLAALEVDPLTPRPAADIKMLVATDPVKHRLRVGEYRIVYIVTPREVKVLEVFRRARGYRE